jgi:type IV secretory pathway VirJ component
VRCAAIAPRAGLPAILALVACALACSRLPAPEPIDAGRLGHPLLFRPSAPPTAFVVLVSDRGGLAPGLERAAAQLAARGAAVVAVDLDAYLRGLAASDDGCHYVVAELEALSQRLQRELGAARYHSPLVAGVGQGAALAYAALAQAPAATVGGAALLDPAPALETRVPLCAGADSTPAATGGFAYAPKGDLPGSLRVAATGEPAAAVRALADATGTRVERARGADPGARLVAALEPLLAREESPDAALADLPLVELPAERPGALFAVIYSGDGGWRDLDKEVAGFLAAKGVPVVGVDSLRYFWDERAPDVVARDLARILAHYRARWATPSAILVGYSFGAGVLPFAVNRLPAGERARVVQVSLLGLAPDAPFQFQIAGWIGAPDRRALPVLPELERIDLGQVQCFYGEDETDSLCRDPALAASERIHTAGGHHFDGDYEALAARILDGARRRAAQRVTTPVTPPEISAATSVSTNGNVSPPGEAR